MAKSTSITVEHPAHGDEATTPPHLKHYFVSSDQQFSASKLGMWLFLLTEILLFGGMFVAYGIYRSMYPELFAMASTQLDTMMGATNTMILLLVLINMFWSMRRGPLAPGNPWGAATLEWTHTTSPPDHHNFHRTPLVTHGPYDYQVLFASSGDGAGGDIDPDEPAPVPDPLVGGPQETTSIDPD